MNFCPFCSSEYFQTIHGVDYFQCGTQIDALCFMQGSRCKQIVDSSRPEYARVPLAEHAGVSLELAEKYKKMGITHFLMPVSKND